MFQTSVPALRENLYSCQIPQQEQSKLTIMQAIFLMMQCTLSEEDCQDMTKETFATLTSLYISSVTAPEVGNLMYVLDTAYGHILIITILNP